MRDQKQLCSALIDNCPDSVLLIDPAGSIRFANPSAVRLFGYTATELLAMNICELEVAVENQQPLSELLRRFQASESLRYNTVRRRKDGTTFPVNISAVPLIIGHETLLLAFDRDIDESSIKQPPSAFLQAELAQKSGLVNLGVMASGLAHELNQPLAALSLYLDSAVELAASFDSAELQESLRRTHEQLQLTRQLLRKIRGFASRGSNRREPVNINLLIREVMSLLATEFQQSGTSTILKLDEPMVLVLADGTQIQQVLVNLIRNGVEAMIDRAGQRQLCLSTQCLQDKVLVTVSDTGSGLDPAIAKQLFLPFQTTKPERLGLGLAICRKLIEAHGGCIGMQPVTGGGTAFYFELPRNTAPDPGA